MLQGGLGVQADMDATKKVRSVAKKAQDLYRQQQKIEKDVKARYAAQPSSFKGMTELLIPQITDVYVYMMGQQAVRLIYLSSSIFWQTQVNRVTVQYHIPRQTRQIRYTKANKTDKR